jgi:ATP adenylyltransferase/5',5'''-P-1,P-4-tetraphosphate phosphorylase II
MRTKEDILRDIERETKELSKAITENNTYEIETANYMIRLLTAEMKNKIINSKEEKSFIVKIEFPNGHIVYKNAGSDFNMAHEIMRNNKIEYRTIDCKITLENN